LTPSRYRGFALKKHGSKKISQSCTGGWLAKTKVKEHEKPKTVLAIWLRPKKNDIDIVVKKTNLNLPSGLDRLILVGPSNIHYTLREYGNTHTNFVDKK
jgi:hypothetical protein